MKISKVIAELEKIKQLSGDLDVVVWPYDGQVTPFPANSVYVLNGTVIFDHEKNEWQCLNCGKYTPNDLLSLVCVHCGVSCLYGPELLDETRKDLTNAQINTGNSKHDKEWRCGF